MLTTATIREAPNDAEGVFAFHIMGEVTAEDMAAMARYMNEQFDRHDKVSMIMIFDIAKGAERGASFDWEVIKSRVRSLTKVEKYAVVDAPENAERMISAMNKFIPTEARAFDTEEEAWEFVQARPFDQTMRG